MEKSVVDVFRSFDEAKSATSDIPLRNLRKTKTSPMADKFMILLAMLALVLRFDFPLWGIFLVLSRDMVSLVGSLIVYIKYHGVWSANSFGKVTTFLQVILVLFYLLNFPFKIWVFWLTSVVSVATALSYFHRSVRIVSQPP